MTLHVAAEELLQELARMEATMVVVARHAGMGHSPDLERRLDTHLRALRVLLDPNGVAVAEDTVDAAKRALDSAEPAAPMLMLKMARGNLSAVVRRQAARSDAWAARAASPTASPWPRRAASSSPTSASAARPRARCSAWMQSLGRPPRNPAQATPAKSSGVCTPRLTSDVALPNHGCFAMPIPCSPDNVPPRLTPSAKMSPIPSTTFVFQSSSLICSFKMLM